MIIDCHGHYTTAPADLQKYRDGQIAALKDPASVPQKANLKISDDQIRESLDGIDTEHVDYLQQALVPLGSETHAGDDVGIFAHGPWAHLFHGVVEQNVIYHVMAKALSLGTP